MKSPSELKAEGLDITAMSSGMQDGKETVSSYIAWRGKRKVYGQYDHKTKQYIEKPA